METLDCRGLSCPGPVIRTKKALEALRPGESLAVEVDSEAGRENVGRFARSRGASVAVEEKGKGVFRLVITSGEKEPQTAGGAPPVVLIAHEFLGGGDDKLGKILMGGFLSTLLEQERVPDRVLLMNGGVRLAVEGSEALEDLRSLTDRGCEILACGTCLDFFGIRERLAVGSVSNMYDIQKVLLEASSVIRP